MQPVPLVSSPGHRESFRDLIAANRRRSALLIVVFCGTVGLLALGLGVLIAGLLSPDGLAGVDWGQAVTVGLGAAAIAALISALGYVTGDGAILGVSGAHPITHETDPQLFNVVEEMAIAAGVPMPRVYEIDDPAPNAFATGRDPQHATIAVTRGLRTQLNREELQGVVAHEMSHVRNEDTRLMLLVTVLVGTIAMLADFIWQLARFTPATGRGGRNRNQGGGLFGVLLLAVGLVLMVLAPLFARILQFAVSREREYLADASAVELTRDPHGLADALRRIDADPHILQTANRGTAHLYIVNPIKAWERRAGSLFASHPPTAERIRRLESLLA